MRNKTNRWVLLVLMMVCTAICSAQSAAPVADSAAVVAQAVDSTASVDSLDLAMAAAAADGESMGFHQVLKMKFIEGNAGFMSLVALVLVLGLAFCIERIIYLSLSEINAKKLMKDIEDRLMSNDVEGAKTLCRDTRGPVASICYQGLLRINESMENIERSIVSYGAVQSANLEKGCSWITLFIAMAPSLGCLGYEGSADHHHLRYHRGIDITTVL